MSNPWKYDVEVLANSPKEIIEITEHLKNPSVRLASMWAARGNKKVAEIANDFHDVVGFKCPENLGYADESVSTTRRFNNFCDSKVDSLVREHLLEVSEAYPTAVFLLTYYDMQSSFTVKQVIRGGTIVQEVCDDQQRSQAVDWVLLDILCPFRAEHNEGLPFGSLWQEWVNETYAAAGQLKALLPQSGAL